MTRRSGPGGGLVATLVTVKDLIGVAAVLGVFYLTVPWRLILVATSEDVTSGEFVTALNEWAISLADNILLLVLLLFIAVLTYGPEVLNLVAGPNGPQRPRR